MQLVRVECRHKTEFIALNDENWAFVDFIQKVADAFGIKTTNAAVFFFDQRNTPIRTMEVLQSAIQQYGNDVNFVLKVQFKSQNSEENESLVTSETLGDYLSENGWKKYFEMYDDEYELSNMQRKDLMKNVVDLMIHHFGYYPEQSEKIMVAKAVMALFPCLETSPSSVGGIDTIFNPSTSTGWLVNCLKARRTKENTKKTSKRKVPESINVSHDYSQEDADADMLFLKQTPYNEDTRAEIEAKLERSAKYRRILVKDLKSNMLSKFPYLFVHPELLLFDFPLVAGSDAPNGFLENWPEYSTQMSNVMAAFNKKVSTKWGDDIKTILMLMKVLPFTPHRSKSKDKRAPAAFVADCFIVFAKDGTPPLNTLVGDRVYPYIVACGKNAKSTSEFYIVVEQQLIQVPRGYTFCHVFDLFFKMHHVLNVKYEPNVENVMNFFAHFFYKMEGILPTTTMTDIFNRISN